MLGVLLVLLSVSVPVSYLMDKEIKQRWANKLNERILSEQCLNYNKRYIHTHNNKYLNVYI